MFLSLQKILSPLLVQEFFVNRWGTQKESQYRVVCAVPGEGSRWHIVENFRGERAGENSVWWGIEVKPPGGEEIIKTG